MNLEKLIKQYIAYRKSLGEKIQSSEMYLKNFCKFVGAKVSITSINENIINNFLYNSSLIVRPNWFNRYKALNGFYQYALARNYITKIPLPKNLPKRPCPATPYIYSRKELKALFDVALNYQIVKSCISPYTVRAILIVTYSLGLRIHETLSIKIGDTDTNNSVITIHQSKFYKSRLVPFNQEVKEFINEYLGWRIKQMQSKSPESPLFISKNNLQFNLGTMNSIFQRIRRKAGIQRNDNSYCQPRVHDLRHTFAVNILTNWYRDNKDIQKLLPILSTYLGHECISYTSIYLTMTDNLLQEANMRFEEYVTKEEL